MKNNLKVQSSLAVKYEWTKNSSFKNKADPNNVQAVIEMLAKQDPNEKCTNEALVEYAEQHPFSDIYNCFEWDDPKAANGFRLMQAGEIKTNLVKIEYKVSVTPQKTQTTTVYNIVKANHALRTEPGYGHKSITVIKSNPQDDHAYEEEMYRTIRQFVNSFKLKFKLANNFAKYEQEFDKILKLLP